MKRSNHLLLALVLLAVSCDTVQGRVGRKIAALDSSVSEELLYAHVHSTGIPRGGPVTAPLKFTDTTTLTRAYQAVGDATREDRPTREDFADVGDDLEEDREGDDDGQNPIYLGDEVNELASVDINDAIVKELNDASVEDAQNEYESDDNGDDSYGDDSEEGNDDTGINSDRANINAYGYENDDAKAWNEVADANNSEEEYDDDGYDDDGNNSYYAGVDVDYQPTSSYRRHSSTVRGVRSGFSSKSSSNNSANVSRSQRVLQMMRMMNGRNRSSSSSSSSSMSKSKSSMSKSKSSSSSSSRRRMMMMSLPPRPMMMRMRMRMMRTRPPITTPVPIAPSVSVQPSSAPSKAPTSRPTASAQPSSSPSKAPTGRPTVSAQPSSQPSINVATRTQGRTRPPRQPMRMRMRMRRPMNMMMVAQPRNSVDLLVNAALDYRFFRGTGMNPTNAEINALVDQTEEFYDDVFDARVQTRNAVSNFQMGNLRAQYAPRGDLDRFILTFVAQVTVPRSSSLDSDDIARIMGNANYGRYIQLYVYEAEPFTQNIFYETNKVSFQGRGVQ